MNVSNVCGNCANFQPKSGDRFFNCTFARQAGVKYSMQVRPDTRSCEAFSAIKQPSKPQATPKPAPQPPAKRAEPPRRGALCNWGRLIVVAGIIILILLIAVLAYTCSHRHPATPTPTPTPAPTQTAPPPTSLRPTPTPAPTPVPITYYNVGDWAAAPPWLLTVTDPVQTSRYYGPGPIDAPPNTFFIIVQVTVTNGGSSTLGVQASQFTIHDKFGLAYPPIQWGQIVGNQFPWESTALAPGQTVSGRILYVVPSIASQLDVEIVVNGQNTLAWALPY